MPDSVGALYVIFLLLPGFVGYLCLARTYNRKIEDGFDKTALVVLITALSIAIVKIGHPVALPAGQDALTGDKVGSFIGYLFPAQTLLCTVIGILLGAIGNSSAFSWVARRIGFSAKAGHAAVLAATIRRHRDSFLRFRFKDGGYVVGHPLLYSLDGEESVVFLEKAAFRRKKADGAAEAPAQVDVDGEGILLVNFDEVLFVEVI